MIRNEQAGRASDLADRPLRHLVDHPRDHSEPRTLVIRHGSRFEVLATNTLDDGFDASPALVDNELYLRGNRYLYCIAEP